MVLRDKGFTLFEILLVVAILSFILYWVSPPFTTTIDKGRVIRLEADIKRIEAAAQLYYLDNYVFPEKLEDLWQRPLAESEWKGPYLSSDTLLLSPEEYLIGNRGRVSILNQ